VQENELYYLVYMSAAVDLPTEAELERILLASRRNNLGLEITGMLLYGEGTFIQLLEGDKQRVLDLYARLGEDGRHRRLMMMLQGTETTRHFPDWSMGFRVMNHQEIVGVPGFNEFMSGTGSVAELSNEPRNARKLLSYFRDNN